MNDIDKHTYDNQTEKMEGNITMIELIVSYLYPLLYRCYTNVFKGFFILIAFFIANPPLFIPILV